MAFFKFRTAGEATSAARQPESIEAMRRRARHRLIGATVLVLAGVVGFPLLFDTQPRPIPVDIPIEIPDRNKAAPLPVPARPAPSAPVASGKVSPAAGVAGTAGVAPVPVAPAPAPKAEAPAPAAPKPEAVATPKPEPKPEPRPAAAKAEPPADATRAKALLEGKAAAEAAADGRFVVQVGAFADPDKAREARARLERAGLKTYTNVAETKAGKRIRVRVGPFPSRADADKAASKIKGLDMPAAILTL
ncbi:SPOR domain-containing protein [Ramlibacter sp. RBP-2]|uniref:SPOR domain-containing protein n=1 Tax=Ramlibacter lithotrophicus TaxID=2606681 RepID=A0A7X6DH63_9BURK|nr:SPOR domain-containing protein [Ramlibacter lithotrophicus]NKE67078.1 SPOR domain-containing protein [Ramlibacter lithotrophicus]